MKKKILFILLVIGVLLYAPTVLAIVTTNGCTSILGANTILDPKIPNVVHTIILVIQIAVPILLVIFGMLDLFKGITAQKEDELKKGQQMFIKRLISAVIIFFVIAIVKLLFGFVTSDDPTKSQNALDCVNCFLNGVDTKTGDCNK